MTLGKRVSITESRQAPNMPFKFDGGQLIATRGGAKVYAFVTKPARERKTQFDDEAHGQLFWGVYGTTPPLAPGSALRADLYYLGFRDDHARYASGTGAETRQTFGVRIFGSGAGFDYDVEPVLQSGTFGRQDILAWTLASSQGYTMEGLPWSPRLGLQADVASGDTGARNTGNFGTFNPLFFKAGYFDDASLIRPSNIMDVHPTVQLHPRDSVQLIVGSDVLWRYTTKDGVYGPPGNLELPAGGGDRYVATRLRMSRRSGCSIDTWSGSSPTATSSPRSTSALPRAATWTSSARGRRSSGDGQDLDQGVDHRRRRHRVVHDIAQALS